MVNFLFKLFGLFDTSLTLFKVIIYTAFIIFWLCLTTYTTIEVMREEQQQKEEGVDMFERVSVFGAIVLMLCLGAIALLILLIILSSKPIMIIVGVIILIFVVSKIVLCMSCKNQNKDKGIKYNFLNFLKKKLS